MDTSVPPQKTVSIDPTFAIVIEGGQMKFFTKFTTADTLNLLRQATDKYMVMRIKEELAGGESPILRV